MVRFFAVLSVVWLLSVSLAEDPTFPSRDANLRLVKSLCLYVDVGSYNDALTRQKAKLRQELLDRAVLYGVPLHSSCQDSDTVVSLIVTDANTSSVNDGLMMKLGVEVNDGSSAYKLPTVWDNDVMVLGPKSRLPDRLVQDSKDLFDSFALAWKKQHAQ